jgi:hypothetical protein
MMKLIVPDGQIMLTMPARSRPITPMNRNLPIAVRSRFVV